MMKLLEWGYRDASKESGILDDGRMPCRFSGLIKSKLSVESD